MVRMTKKFFTSRKIVIYFSHRVLLGNKQNFERGGGGGSKRGDMLNQLFYHINTSNKFMPHIQYLCEAN